MKPRFGVLSYRNTLNIGDEIQSLAAAQFISSPVHFLNRDDLKIAPPNPIKMIMNGWYMHEPQNWPPHQDITPLMTSIHLSNEITAMNKLRLKPSRTLLSEQNIDYFHAHGPIGARDLSTLEMLHSHGVDAYFSACMTLTFPKWLGARNEKVVCVDLDDEVFEHLQRKSPFDLSRESHAEYSNDRDYRFNKALRLLDSYKNARMVITTRLHAALPSLALGTPVLFIDTAPDSYRFAGLRELVHTLPRDALLKPFGQWWRSEFETNKHDHVDFATAHRKRVAAFVDARDQGTENAKPIVAKSSLSSIESREKIIELIRPAGLFADLDHRFELDLQGWNSEHPIFAEMIDDVKPELIVEVGTWKGASAVHMAKVCSEKKLSSHLVCVDTWLGNWQAWTRSSGPGSVVDLHLKDGFPHLYWQFMSNVKLSGVEASITPLPLPSHAAGKFFQHNRIAPDLIYLDGDHEYEAAKVDLDTWYELLRPGGVLIGDDLGFPGVGRAVAEFEALHGKKEWTDGSKFVFRKPKHLLLGNLGSSGSEESALDQVQDWLNNMPVLLFHGDLKHPEGSIVRRFGDHPNIVAIADSTSNVDDPAIEPNSLSQTIVISDASHLSAKIDFHRLQIDTPLVPFLDPALLEAATNGENQSLFELAEAIKQRSRLRIVVFPELLGPDDVLLRVAPCLPPSQVVFVYLANILAYPESFVDGVLGFAWLESDEKWRHNTIKWLENLRVNS